MASDLDGFKWRPLFRSQSWTLWEQDSIEAIWEVSVDEFVPMYSWVSSAYWWKDTMLFWLDWSEFMTFAIGDMKRTKCSGPRTEPWGTPVSTHSKHTFKGRYGKLLECRNRHHYPWTLWNLIETYLAIPYGLPWACRIAQNPSFQVSLPPWILSHPIIGLPTRIWFLFFLYF